MSNPLRISFVTEGPTDYVVLRAVVRALLGGADFEPVALQPELAESLRTKSASGWGGVYFWCLLLVSTNRGPNRRSGVLESAFRVRRCFDRHPGRCRHRPTKLCRLRNQGCSEGRPALRASLSAPGRHDGSAAKRDTWVAKRNGNAAPSRALHAVQEYRNLGSGRVVSGERASGKTEHRMPLGSRRAVAEIRPHQRDSETHRRLSS